MQAVEEIDIDEALQRLRNVINNQRIYSQPYPKESARCRTIYIYILRCEDDYYYVGQTRYLHGRLQNHFAGVGAIFTAIHRPQSVLCYFKANMANHSEQAVTDEFKRVFGDDKVCGGRNAGTQGMIHFLRRYGH